MFSYIPYTVCAVAVAAMAYTSAPLALFSKEIHEYEELEYKEQVEYEEEAEYINGQLEQDIQPQVSSTEITERYPRRSCSSSSPTRHSPNLNQEQFLRLPTYYQQPQFAPTVPPRSRSVFSSPSRFNNPPVNATFVEPQPVPHADYSALQKIFDDLASLIAETYSPFAHSASEELDRRITGQQGVNDESCHDVNYDMDDQDMEGTIPENDDTDVNMEQQLVPNTGTAPAPFTTLETLLQAASGYQARLEQQISALMELERLSYEALPEITRRSMTEFAQRLFTQVREALSANESPLSEVDARCIRFWNETLAIQSPNVTPKPATTSTSTQEDTQPKAPTISTSAPSSSQKESNEVLTQSQSTFLSAFSSSKHNFHRDQEALWYSTTTKSKVTGPGSSRSPYTARETTPSRKGSPRPTGTKSRAPIPSPSTSMAHSVFRATSKGDMRRRSPSEGNVVVGTEKDFEFRLQWEKELDKRLKKSQPRRERERAVLEARRIEEEIEQEKARVLALAQAARAMKGPPKSILKKRRRDEMEEEEEEEQSRAQANTNSTNNMRLQLPQQPPEPKRVRFVFERVEVPFDADTDTDTETENGDEHEGRQRLGNRDLDMPPPTKRRRFFGLFGSS